MVAIIMMWVRLLQGASFHSFSFKGQKDYRGCKNEAKQRASHAERENHGSCCPTYEPYGMVLV